MKPKKKLTDWERWQQQYLKKLKKKGIKKDPESGFYIERTETFTSSGSDTIIVQYATDIKNLRTNWRLIVNKDIGSWSGYYQGVYVHKGYALATDYWTGTLPVEIPFRITLCFKI